MTHTGSDGETPGLSPDEAFALVGNETRMAILRTLWEAYDPYASDNSVPFSDIYDRVELEDTGNFNYHLGKLTGHFVRQTDGGYALTQLGFYIVRGVIAGTVGERPRVDPARIDADCPRCEGSVEIVYRDLAMQAQCTQCSGIWDRDDDSSGHLFLFNLPPAGLVDRTPKKHSTRRSRTSPIESRRFETAFVPAVPAGSRERSTCATNTTLALARSVLGVTDTT